MTIRVGLIGCGWIGSAHSRVIKGLIGGGLVDAEAVAFADPDIDKAAAFAASHRARVATQDPARVLDAVDAVWICTPTATHRALVEQAAAAGVAIYCEKPLATNAADVDAMVAAVEAAGVANQVGLVLRAAAPLARLQQLIDSGDDGRPMAAVLRDDQYFPIQGRYATGTWRADVAISGGGTLIEHSIHDLDVLAWLLGDITEVTATTSNFAGHPGIEDVAAVTLRHAGGATSSLVSVWHQVLSRGSVRRLEVFCEKAMFWLDDEDMGPVHVERSEAVTEIAAPTAAGWLDDLAVTPELRPALSAYAAADRAFLLSLAAGRRPHPDFSVARAAHRVADAAYRSAREGMAPVRIALL
jgi:predicted dehydrogenase